MRKTRTQQDLGKVGIETQSQAAGTVDGVGIDCAGFEFAELSANTGVIAATGELDQKVQDSPDNSTFTDVAGAVFPQLVPAGDQVLVKMHLDLRPLERFIRLRSVVANAACLTSVTVDLYGGSIHRPVTQDETVIEA